MQHQNLISKQKMIEKAHQRMRSLVRYDYSFMDFLFSILNNIPCLFVCCCRSKNRLHLKKRNSLFNKGGDKFIKEFDAVRYAKSMREVQTLLKSMIDDKERFIIPYQKCNSIAMHSESDSDHGDDNYAKVPKMFAKSKIKELHRAEVDEFMEEYSKENWSDRDYRLVNGVIASTNIADSDLAKVIPQTRENRKHENQEIEFEDINPNIEFEESKIMHPEFHVGKKIKPPLTKDLSFPEMD
ncbi:unnamed protein product [Moneuplotes crassus]|uniref:Uncharacterized protein n=1 Tax=Euplotes crassus TaxID=5936 RepID=A0AAD1XQT6_EUPCR|nr:unnamed protein product [Moneuplotes crassus]